ncbi:MAG: UPF0262 family protein [Alphaproteobacteria bacterium]
MNQDADPPRAATQRIANITLDERLVVRRGPEIEHERAVAIFDLLEHNSFDPGAHHHGPFNVHLSLRDGRVLVLDIADASGAVREQVTLPLTPLRSLIKDYFTVCESYFQAIKTATPSRIEAIDMGRRGLHDEGSEALRERLAAQVRIDKETARRLFTLICVLHIRG